MKAILLLRNTFWPAGMWRFKALITGSLLSS